MQPIAQCLNYIICGGIIVHSTTCQYFPGRDADIWYPWLTNQHIPRVPIFVGESHRCLSKNHISDFFLLLHLSICLPQEYKYMFPEIDQLNYFTKIEFIHIHVLQ